MTHLAKILTLEVGDWCNFGNRPGVEWGLERGTGTDALARVLGLFGSTGVPPPEQSGKQVIVPQGVLSMVRTGYPQKSRIFSQKFIEIFKVFTLLEIFHFDRNFPSSIRRKSTFG